MMKSLFSKLKRKLGAGREQETHPDLEPQGPRAEQPAVGPRAASREHAGRVPINPAFAWTELNEETLHPDLELIDPLFKEEFPLMSPRGESPVPAEPATSKAGVLPDEADAGSEAEHESGDKQPPDRDAAPASPAHGVSAFADVLKAAEVDHEDEAFAEAEEELWETELAFEVDGEAEDGGIDEALFDGEFGELLELAPYEIQAETESAQWEDLLDLELYEEDTEPSPPYAEEEGIVESRQLEDYTAKLVSQMPSIKLDERSRVQSRFKAILEEFPFSASYRALSRLVSAGVSLEALEDACELKCLWREAPWLWSRRLFNKMQRTWETEERATYRNALTWKLAIELIRAVGRPEAERKIFDDWLSEWQRMGVEQSRVEGRMDPQFWSYPAYLQLNAKNTPLIHDDVWCYGEVADRKALRSLRLYDEGGEIWRFEPKSNYRDTGFLSRRPLAERIAEEEKAKRKETKK
mgnify:FL=1